MGSSERYMRRVYNKARRNPEPIQHWPSRIVAFLIVVSGTVAGIAITFHVQALARSVETFSAFDPTVLTCFYWCFGLGSLTILNCLSSIAVIRKNKSPLLFILNVFVDLLLMLFITLILACGAMVVLFAEWQGNPTHGMYFKRTVILLVFLLISWIPVLFAINTRFRVTRKIRAWNYRTRFIRTIYERADRLNERYDYRRKVGMFFNGLGALLLLLAPLGFIVATSIDAPRGASLWANIYEELPSHAIFPALFVVFAVSAKRHKDRSPAFPTITKKKDWIGPGFDMAIIMLVSTIVGNIISKMTFGIAYVLGWPIGTVVGGLCGVAAYSLFLMKLINHWDGCVDELIRKLEAEKAEDVDEQVKGERRPAQAADEATIDELFAKPDAATKATKE